MCDLHTKFEEYRTKTAVAIVDDKFAQIDTETNRQTDRRKLK